MGNFFSKINCALKNNKALKAIAISTITDEANAITKLIKSVDNDFSTSGDNTVMSGITFSLNGSWIFVENINTLIDNSTANFFLTLDNINDYGGRIEHPIKLQ